MTLFLIKTYYNKTYQYFIWFSPKLINYVAEY